MLDFPAYQQKPTESVNKCNIFGESREEFNFNFGGKKVFSIQINRSTFYNHSLNRQQSIHPNFVSSLIGGLRNNHHYITAFLILVLLVFVFSARHISSIPLIILLIGAYIVLQLKNDGTLRS